jgi:hypothetical protein
MNRSERAIDYTLKFDGMQAVAHAPARSIASFVMVA